MSKVNNIFIVNHEEVSIVGACAGIRSKVASFIIKEEDQARFSSFNEDDCVIVIDEHLTTQLSEDELNAIVAHEQGHIHYGHMHSAAAEGVEGVIDNMQYELEADAFAIEKCGAAALLSGMKKAIASTLNAAIKHYEVPETMRLHVTKAALKALKPRLSALRSAI